MVSMGLASIGATGGITGRSTRPILPVPPDENRGRRQRAVDSVGAMSSAPAKGAELLALLGDRDPLLILAELARRDGGATLGEPVEAPGRPVRSGGDAWAPRGPPGGAV